MRRLCSPARFVRLTLVVPCPFCLFFIFHSIHQGADMLTQLERSLPLLLHPGVFVRRGVEELLYAAARQLGVPDAFVILTPLLQPFLTRPFPALERPLLPLGAALLVGKRSNREEADREDEDGAGAGAGEDDMHADAADLSLPAFAAELRRCALRPLSWRAFGAQLQMMSRHSSGSSSAIASTGESSSDSEPEEGVANTTPYVCLCVGVCMCVCVLAEGRQGVRVRVRARARACVCVCVVLFCVSLCVTCVDNARGLYLFLF